MRALRLFALGVFSAAACCTTVAEQVGTPALNAAEIMARVAANQDRAEQARTHYVYLQHAHVLSRRGKTVMCEERTESRITPTADGSHAELLKLQGRMFHKHVYVPYTTLEHGKSGSGDASEAINLDEDELDRGLVEDLRADLTHDDSKDGFDRKLFPHTSKAQGEYLFDLAGRESINGRDVYHLTFYPKDKSAYDWKGEAYIDAAEYQPVAVSTELARKVPFAVRTLLGTNVPGLGFAITYAPQPDGIWFPVSFGTEFKLRVLFFFSREIVIDARNTQFEKIHVSSRILEPEPGSP